MPSPRKRLGHARVLGRSRRRLARRLARVAVGMGAAVEPQLREAPVMAEGSWVGIDLHARSAVAGVLDGRSGELRVQRVPAASGPLVVGLCGLFQPARVAYEAGPTGFELARACVSAGMQPIFESEQPRRRAARSTRTEEDARYRATAVFWGAPCRGGARGGALGAGSASSLRWTDRAHRPATRPHPPTRASSPPRARWTAGRCGYRSAAGVSRGCRRDRCGPRSRGQRGLSKDGWATGDDGDY